MADEIDVSGQQVGRYKLLSPLGAGGMGVVYDAIDSSLDRHVAVKILARGLVTDAARVQRFVLEAKSASALDHPHVVSIHEVGTATIGDREIRFIAMEKVVGMTLRKAIASGADVLRRKLELAVQIFEAIAAAHDAGIIHRDLKPENVMVSDNGYAKVVDFGLAKLRESDHPERGETDSTAMMPTRTGAIVGTSGYMSPEQAQGRPIDHRTDIFAIGCILYELVSGRKAFRGDSAVDTLHLIIHSEPEPILSAVPGVPTSLQRIVTKALNKDPGQRYQSTKDLAIDLREVIEELALTDLAARRNETDEKENRDRRARRHHPRGDGAHRDQVGTPARTVDHGWCIADPRDREDHLVGKRDQRIDLSGWQIRLFRGSHRLEPEPLASTTRDRAGPRASARRRRENLGMHLHA